LIVVHVFVDPGRHHRIGGGMPVRPRGDTLGSRFLHTAKRNWSSFCVADSTGRELTFGRALVASLLLARAIGRHAPAETAIGLLLPASVGGALANVAASFAGKVPVNLNFTAGRDAMAAAIERCEISAILTSHAFLEKAGLAPMPGVFFLEDLLHDTSTVSKAAMLAAARLLPAPIVERLFISRPNPHALATIIFSSGSTGVPKGVMLTHRNVLANIDAATELFKLTPDDVVLGVLPFFHSFGFTVTLWLPLVVGVGAAYHPNPTDAKTIGELAARYGATLLISTPTFCASYVRKCQPEQFARLRLAIVGAERLREPIAAAFKDKFGVELTEGYGCTEMAPVVAVNVPGEGIADARRGSVGRPLPGISAMVVDLETGEGPLIGKEGLLLVNGPNRMVGYLGEPDLTRQALRDGWYVTGDIGTIDDAGFIRITDRLSRFSKIAGEMVPHMKVEEQLQALLRDPHVCVVTAVPDPVKGERLVALHTDPDLPAQEVWDRLSRSDLPKLWVPKREDLRFVESIPTLGTGKVDLRAVRQLASSRT
jgi:acyl-[acyl-carrier-protein]-phospholipid O-acyltransferase/long-chain-fatty-acid--[acyl-carrier-protein] ligase